MYNSTTKSYYQPNKSNEFVEMATSTLEDSMDRQSFLCSLSTMDQQMYQYYADKNYNPGIVQRQLYQNRKSVTLGVPKHNSLTDSMLRTTMGCEEKYLLGNPEIVDMTQHREDQEKKKRIERIKNQFAESNIHRDSGLNTKPFLSSNYHFANQRPVIDNEHQSYLKTQLMFIEQPKGGTPSSKEYFDKHTESIAKKITQLGGIEDTVTRMEESLNQNEVKNGRKKQMLKSISRQEKQMFSPRREKSGLKRQQSWVNRSRQMRQTFVSRLHLE